MAKVISDIGQLEQYYTIKNQAEVQEFLTPPMIEALLDGVPEILKIFPDAELTLAILTDYEEPDYQKLTIYIKVDPEMENRIEKLHQLDDVWFLELPIFIRMQLITTIDYNDEL